MSAPRTETQVGDALALIADFPLHGGCKLMAMITQHPDNSEKVEKMGGVEVLLRVMQSFSKHEQVQRWACLALHGLAGAPDARFSGLGDTSAWRLVTQAMALYPRSPALQLHGCAAASYLRIMREPSEADPSALDKRVITVLIDAITANIAASQHRGGVSHHRILEWAVMALRPRIYDTYSVLEAALDLCPPISLILENYPLHPTIPLSVCRFIQDLSENAKNSWPHLFVKTGVCQALVHMLLEALAVSIRATTRDHMRAAMKSMISLSVGSGSASRQEFRKAGACNPLLSVVDADDLADTDLKLVACHALSHNLGSSEGGMSGDDVVRALGVMENVLLGSVTDGSLCSTIVLAVSAMASNIDLHRVLPSLDLPSLVVKAFQGGPSEVIFHTYCCKSVAALASVRGLADRLVEASACEAVLGSLKMFPDFESVRREAWRAVLSLASASHSAKARMIDAGMSELAAASLRIPYESVWDRDERCQLLGAIGAVMEGAEASQISILVAAGACDVVAHYLEKVLRIPYKSRGMVENALWALRALALGCGCDLAVKGRRHLRDLVVEAMGEYRGDAKILAHATEIVLAWSNDRPLGNLLISQKNLALTSFLTTNDLLRLSECAQSLSHYSLRLSSVRIVPDPVLATKNGVKRMVNLLDNQLHLRHLRLGDIALMPLLPVLKSGGSGKLKVLDFTRCDFRGEGGERAIGHLQLAFSRGHLRALEELNLAGIKVDIDSFVALMSPVRMGSCPSLRALTLRDIEMDSVEYTKQLARVIGSNHLQNLQRLDLHDSIQIPDGFIPIARALESVYPRDLRALTLSSCDLTVADCVALSQALSHGEMKGLTELDLTSSGEEGQERENGLVA